MPNTTTRGITSPDGTQGWDLTDDLQTMAQSTDDAITAAVNGLPTRDDLAKKADAQHTHAQNDITGLVDALAAKANTADLPAAGAQDLVGTQDTTCANASGWGGVFRVQRLGKHHAILTGTAWPSTSKTGTATVATLPAWATPAKADVRVAGVTAEDTPRILPVIIAAGSTSITVAIPTSAGLATTIYASVTYPID